MKTYKIIRFFKEKDQETILEGLSKEQALEYCKDLDTSSKTCYSLEKLELTRKNGEWFDAFVEEE